MTLDSPLPSAETKSMSRLSPAKRFIAILLLTSPVVPMLWAESGYASWYGGKFQGRKTASGEIFDTHQLTAAHKTLPFGSIVRVTNQENGKSVEVRINDRGPFVEGRIIDLSMAAAMEIGMLGSGVAPVEIEVLKRGPEDERVEGQDYSDSISIQVASFQDPNNAEDLLRRLRRKGFSSHMEMSSSGHHRVVILDVEEDELERTIEQLSDLGHSSVLVRRHF